MENGSTVYEDIVKLKEAAIHIRKESQKGHLVEKDTLKDVVGIGEDEVEPLLARLPDFPEFMDLKSVIDGNGMAYLYSGTEMTDRYMEILIGLKNKNLLNLIAETVRYESQKYPRPTRVDLFTKKPYSIGYEELKELLDCLGEASEYSDLKFTEASNGTKFMYSERHMTGFYATKLAEWHEVLQHETP
jgi:hypothetical protein